MEEYVTALFESELPFEPWVAALAWIALFAVNHWVARVTRVANDSQKVISVEDWSALRRGFEPKYIVAKIFFVAVVFVLALLLGEPAFVLLAGGLLIATVYGLALNVQGLLSARAMARADEVNGALSFSTASAFRHMAHRAAGGALACLLTGLLLAQLAPLGAALFLASTANGYLRRARNARAQA